MMKKLLGISVDGLSGRQNGSSMNKRRRTDSSVACACGRTSVGSDEMVVQCNSCQYLSHANCISNPGKRATPIVVIPGDLEYEFTCDGCSKTRVCTYKPKQKAWVQVARLAVFNIQRTQFRSLQEEFGDSFEKLVISLESNAFEDNELMIKYLRCLGFVRFKEIVTYVMEHWKQLCGSRSVTATWENTLNASMSTHPQIFRPARAAVLESPSARGIMGGFMKYRFGNGRVTNSVFETFVMNSVKCWWGVCPTSQPVDGWLPGGFKYMNTLEPVPFSDSEGSDIDVSESSVPLDDYVPPSASPYGLVTPTTRDGGSVSLSPAARVPSTPRQNKDGLSLGGAVVPGTPVVLVRTTSEESVGSPCVSTSPFPSERKITPPAHDPTLVIKLPNPYLQNTSSKSLEGSPPDSRARFVPVAGTNLELKSVYAGEDGAISPHFEADDFDENGLSGMWSWGLGLGQKDLADRLEALAVEASKSSFVPPMRKRKSFKKLPSLSRITVKEKIKPLVQSKPTLKVPQKSPVQPQKQKVSWDLDNVVMPYEWLDAPPRQIELPAKHEIPVPKFRILRGAKKDAPVGFSRPRGKYIKALELPNFEPTNVFANPVDGCCFHCRSTSTPVWRKVAKFPGKDLCNACGLYYWKYGSLRPSSLVANDKRSKPRKRPRDGQSKLKNKSNPSRKRRKSKGHSDSEDTSDEAFFERHRVGRAWWSLQLARAEVGIDRSSSSLNSDGLDIHSDVRLREYV